MEKRFNLKDPNTVFGYVLMFESSYKQYKSISLNSGKLYKTLADAQMAQSQILYKTIIGIVTNKRVESFKAVNKNQYIFAFNEKYIFVDNLYYSNLKRQRVYFNDGIVYMQKYLKQKGFKFGVTIEALADYERINKTTKMSENNKA